MEALATIDSLKWSLLKARGRKVIRNDDTFQIVSAKCYCRIRDKRVKDGVDQSPFGMCHALYILLSDIMEEVRSSCRDTCRSKCSISRKTKLCLA